MNKATGVFFITKSKSDYNQLGQIKPTYRT